VLEEMSQLVPAGTWHAVVDDHESTACGKRVAGLHEFRDQPWQRGLTFNRCEDCLAIHPLELPHPE
jgi:hypothetical protein